MTHRGDLAGRLINTSPGYTSWTVDRSNGDHTNRKKMSEAFWKPATEEQVLALYDSLGVTQETLDDDVAAIREWMAQQPHFPDVPDSANPWIAKYILRCKNSLQKTKDTLDHLFTGRNTMPEFFRDRDPLRREIQDSFDQVHIATMPTLTPDGERVHVYSYPDDADASLFDVPALFRRVLMLAELLMRDDLSRAEIIILDLKNGSPSRLAQFTTHATLLKKLAGDGLKMYPARMKEFHLINTPPFTAMILSLLGLVLKDKLYKRIKIHSSGLKELMDQIPAESLPSDYGGSGPSVADANQMWKRLLEANRDWFQKLENFKTDESKRIHNKKAVVSDDILGCQGSFRRLTVD